MPSLPSDNPRAVPAQEERAGAVAGTCCCTFIITVTTHCQAGRVFLDWERKNPGIYQRIINTKATLILAVFTFPYTYTNWGWFFLFSSFSRQGNWCLSTSERSWTKRPRQGWVLQDLRRCRDVRKRTTLAPAMDGKSCHSPQAPRGK